MNIYLDSIKREQFILENHLLLTSPVIENKEELRIFMESHVYAVWDFMSMLKFLQNAIVPTAVPWVPTTTTRSNAARLINEIVIAEETDLSLWGASLSHFDLYCQSMLEVGANVAPIMEFVETVKTQGIDAALKLKSVPPESRDFVQSTFNFINSGKPQVVAAAFCFGRETLITDMFSGLLTQLKIPAEEAPRFYYYLDRHIEIDGNEHGPASLELIDLLCEKDPVKIIEAEKGAVEAIHARIRLWDAVLKKIQPKKLTKR
jgi:Protein of unknown function (DUF3050)